MSAVVAAVVALLIGGAAGTRGRAEEPGGPDGVPGFHHLHLNSADPAGAVAFYTRWFPSSVPDTVAGVAAVRTGHVLILISRQTPRPAGPSAYWHFGWHVPSAVAAWQRFTSEGAPLAPLYADDGSHVSFSGEWWAGTLTRAAIAERRASGAAPASRGFGYGYLAGPDGARIEFQGDLPAERFNHVHMFQEQPYCAERWYAAHLHAPLSEAARRSQDRPAAAAACEVTPGEPSWLSLTPEGTRRTPAGGVLFDDVEMNWYQRQGARPLAPSRGGVMDHVALSVRDLDGWLRRLRREGVRVVSGPRAFGTGRAAMIEGPSRETIELVEERR